MKKILSLVLILLILPVTALALTGCDKHGDLSKFYASYLEIAENSQNLTLVEANDNYGLQINSQKIAIDYSPQLSQLVENTSSPYHNLKYFYQQLLDDSLAPLYLFGDVISNSNKLNEKQADNLYSQLNQLKVDYEEIDYYAGILITSLATNNDPTINLSHLKKLFARYEQTLNTATRLSGSICDIYFNIILTNADIDISSKDYNELTDADLTNLAINVRSRFYYYKAIYANVCNQLYIKSGNLADTLLTTAVKPNLYQPYTYISAINSLTNKGVEVLRANKEAIYNNMIALYNIQNSIPTAYNHFLTATNNITYLTTNQNSSTNELYYKNIASQFANGIAYDSYEIISTLMTILYA